MIAGGRAGHDLERDGGDLAPERRDRAGHTLEIASEEVTLVHVTGRGDKDIKTNLQHFAFDIHLTPLLQLSILI